MENDPRIAGGYRAVSRRSEEQDADRNGQDAQKSVIPGLENSLGAYNDQFWKKACVFIIHVLRL